jgi:hypothetical protein
MALYRCSNGSFCLPCSAFQPNSTGKKSHQAWCRTTPAVLIYSQPVKCCINPRILSYMPWMRGSMAGGETRFRRCPVSIDGVFVLLTVQICQFRTAFPASSNNIDLYRENRCRSRTLERSTWSAILNSFREL